MKFIVDTDGGVDDVMALYFLLKSNAEIVGITCVGGNTHLHHCLNNVTALLHHLNISCVPVFQGAVQPLTYELLRCPEFMGEDGLGDTLDESHRQQVKSWAAEHQIVHADMDAATFIVDQVVKNQVGIICLGPLTNIAMAINKCPDIAEKCSKLVIMGGSTRGVGNISEIGEYNFYVDPHAAHICIEKTRWRNPVKLVDWHLSSIVHGVPFDDMELLLKKNPFLDHISMGLMAKVKAQDKSFPLPDPLCALVAILPDHCVKVVKKRIQIETSEGLCRGYSVVDWRDDTQIEDGIHIIQEIDQDSIKRLLQVLSD